MYQKHVASLSQYESHVNREKFLLSQKLSIEKVIVA